jgi:hypothetical protein
MQNDGFAAVRMIASQQEGTENFLGPKARDGHRFTRLSHCCRILLTERPQFHNATFCCLFDDGMLLFGFNR